MTAKTLLAQIAAIATPALPGWTVLQYYGPDAADRQLDIGFSTATYGGFVLGGYQVLDTLNLRLFIRLGDTPDVAYAALLDARDALMKAILQNADALANAGAVLFPAQSPYPQSEPPQVAADTLSTLFWQVILRLPLERRL
jgi:hypothetical protein